MVEKSFKKRWFSDMESSGEKGWDRVPDDTRTRDTVGVPGPHGISQLYEGLGKWMNRPTPLLTCISSTLLSSLSNKWWNLL